MDSNQKIDLINAYRQLVGTQLKISKNIPEAVASMVQAEFKAFVDSRIEELLNGKQAQATTSVPSQFSEDEVEILRALIEGVKAKQSGTAPRPRRPVKQQQQPGSGQYDQPETSLRGSSGARPLVDEDHDGSRLRNSQEALLRSLQQMEDSGPEF